MAIYQMQPKHPHKYGLMLMVNKDDYKKFDKYKKQLNPFIEFYMNPSFFKNIAPQHLSICYFSYPEKYSEEYITCLISKITNIAKKFMPMRIKVKGLLGWWELDVGVPAIFWNITDLNKTRDFHNEIIELLKKDIEHFNDPELDFTPHVGVALAKEACKTQIKKIVDASKKDKEITLNLNSLYIFFPTKPKEILKIKS